MAKYAEARKRSYQRVRDEKKASGLKIYQIWAHPAEIKLIRDIVDEMEARRNAGNPVRGIEDLLPAKVDGEEPKAPEKLRVKPPQNWAYS